MFLRIFQHLLPNARAWRLIVDKQLREYFTGLTGIGTDIKAFFDEIYNDLDPQQTRELTQWENQFGLPNTLTVEQDRRDRLDAIWKATGGQSPRYIQDTLQAAGFDVYVHDWWVPGTEPAIGIVGAATARNPFTYLDDGITLLIYNSLDNGADMQDGDIADAQDGDKNLPAGYPLVNKLLVPISTTIGDGSIDMQDGDGLAMDVVVIAYVSKVYQIPADTTKYPYFLYIGGATFPDIATIPSARRNEFETLCLKICPTQLWLGIIVNYS